MENKGKSSNLEVKKRARIYPSNIENEQSLLCCLLIDGTVLNNYRGELSEEMFFDSRHREIFNAITSVQNGNIDIITTNDQLVRSGNADSTSLEYLVELSNLLPSSANVSSYIDALNSDKLLRKIIESCNKIIEEAYSSTDAVHSLRNAEKLILEISQKMSESGGLKQIGRAANTLLQRLFELRNNPGLARGLRTGFPEFDRVTNGLQNGDLIILAARPSVGKTAFALNLVSNIFNMEDKPKTIAIFSLEMPDTQLAQRLLANLSGVSMSKLGKANFMESEGALLWSAQQKMQGSKIYVDDRSLTSPGEILSQCRRLPSITKSEKVDLVVIDYLQLMNTDDKSGERSRQEAVASMSRTMKIMAKELDCPVIVLSQMSRGIEGRTDKTPMLSDLRESGSIEQDADIVMFLSRKNEADKNQSNIILNIAKHRNGELSDIEFMCQGEFMRFTELKSVKVDEQQNSTNN